MRCGRSLEHVSGSRHHRQLRRHGDHSAANLVLLCGSGTTGCHGWVHANPAKAKALGLIVSGWHEAQDVPVYRERERQWVLQDKEGNMFAITGEAAADRMKGLGVL